MAGKIVVPINKKDRVEEIIPYLDKIARPENSVVFLVPYLADGLGSFIARVGAIQTEMQSLWDTQAMAEHISWEGQRRSAEHKVSAAQEALKARGVKVTVDLYTGSLKKALKKHEATGQVHFVLMGPGSRFNGMKTFSAVTPFLRSFRKRSVPPMLVMRPQY